MMFLKQRIEEVVPSVVAAYRCNGTVDWQLEKHPYYPPTVNDAGAAAFAHNITSQLLGSANVSTSATASGILAVCGPMP